MTFIREIYFYNADQYGTALEAEDCKALRLLTDTEDTSPSTVMDMKELVELAGDAISSDQPFKFAFRLSDDQLIEWHGSWDEMERYKWNNLSFYLTNVISNKNTAIAADH